MGTLSFDEKPDYCYLRGLFKRAFDRIQCLDDGVLDWMVARRPRASATPVTLPAVDIQQQPKASVGQLSRLDQARVRTPSESGFSAQSSRIYSSHEVTDFLAKKIAKLSWRSEKDVLIGPSEGCHLSSALVSAKSPLAKQVT